MLDEILDRYPGNRAIYERLKALLDDGSAIAFVGAGASYPLYPLWKELIDRLAAEAVRRGLASVADSAYWLRNASTRPIQMVSLIRSKLGNPYYYPFLYETFKPPTDPGADAFTAAHAALMRARFKACITTNFDPGLLEARRVLRPDIHDSSFTVWDKTSMVNRWSSGDLFEERNTCPVLYAHGHFEDAENLVLDRDGYRRAYGQTPYRRLFEDLWYREHLVFVGFSFNDAVLTQIADEVLWQTARQGRRSSAPHSGPRAAGSRRLHERTTARVFGLLSRRGAALPGQGNYRRLPRPLRPSGRAGLFGTGGGRARRHGSISSPATHCPDPARARLDPQPLRARDHGG